MLLEDLLDGLSVMKRDKLCNCNEEYLNEVIGFLDQFYSCCIDTRDKIIEKLIKDDKIKELEENFEEPITISNKEELRKFVSYLTGNGDFPKECSVYVYRQQEIEELLKDLVNGEGVDKCNSNVIKEFLEVIVNRESTSRKNTELQHLDFDGQVNNTGDVCNDDKHNRLRETVCRAIEDVLIDNMIENNEHNIDLILNEINFTRIEDYSDKDIISHVSSAIFGLRSNFTKCADEGECDIRVKLEQFIKEKQNDVRTDYESKFDRFCNFEDDGILF